MNLSDAVDDLLGRAKGVVKKSQYNRLHIYATGLKSKAAQVDYCLSRMEHLNQPTDEDTDEGLKSQALIELYTDSFWTFLYSHVDITAQIINQALGLRIDEKSVSFKSLAKYLRSNRPGQPIVLLVDNLEKSRAFSNTNKYRNCSNHRRPIFIEHVKKEVSFPAAYAATGRIQTIERYLCDDPLKINAKTAQKRPLIEYSKWCKEQIEDRIVRLVQCLL